MVLLCILSILLALACITLVLLFVINRSAANRHLRDAETLVSTRQEFAEYSDLMDREVMILQTDKDGKVTKASKAFSQFAGYSPEELVGQSFRQILQPEALPEHYRELWSSLAATFGWRDEIASVKKDGATYWAEVSVSPMRNHMGELLCFHAVVHDITSRKRVELLSITDELTGLHNRRYFNQVFSRELARARRAKELVAFCILDVDHFKLYNDHFGHQKGDDVLQSIGKCLRDILRRPTDYSFRLGGEEFGVLLIGMNNESVIMFMERIRSSFEALAISHPLNKPHGVVTVSMGLCLIPQADPELLPDYYAKADAMLYEAKEQGRNRIQHVLHSMQ